MAILSILYSWGEAMLMEISDESSLSWNTCTTFVKAALSGLTLHYEAICWAYTMAIRKLTRSQPCHFYQNLSHNCTLCPSKIVTGIRQF